MAAVGCEYDYKIYIRGGGSSGQSQCIAVAIARGLTKAIPSLRPLFMRCNLLNILYFLIYYFYF